MEQKNIFIGGGGIPKIPPPNTSVSPGADFYAFINGNWLRHVHMPSFSGSYGVSEEMETYIRNQLLQIVLNLKRSYPTHPLSILANSFLNTSFQQNSVIDLQRFSNLFECMNTIEDVFHSIGAMNKIQSRAPISCVVRSDSNNSSKCVVYLYEVQLGLPLRKYYRTHNRIQNHYFNLLKEVGKLLNIEGLELALTIEKTIEPHLASEGDLRDISFMYNPLTFKQLCDKYPLIPWQRFFGGWGLKSPIVEETTFIITNPTYMTVLNEMCNSFHIDAWRVWLRSLLILSFMEYLPPPFDDLYHRLYGKSLRGVSEKLPQKWLMLRVLENYTTQDLSRIFVDKKVPKDTKQLVTEMVKKLKRATIIRLRNLTWMSPEGKAFCIQKVQKMMFQIAYPEKWESETANIFLYPNRPLLNIINLNEADTRKMIEGLQKKCGRYDTSWEDGAFVVNAYYYAESNRMTIPAGQLLPPFFDLNKSIGWNFGGIGAAISHEITHGFDDDGLNYDADGNYRENMNISDVSWYNKMTKQVVELFDKQKYMGGLVNGELTLSENLADLGGVAIALTALNLELKNLETKEKKKAWKDFFTSYAVSWRNKDRVKKAKQSLSLDVHAPASLRVNLIVKNFEEFFEAFEIKEGDEGWVAPEERIIFW